MPKSCEEIVLEMANTVTPSISLQPAATTCNVPLVSGPIARGILQHILAFSTPLAAGFDNILPSNIDFLSSITITMSGIEIAGLILGAFPLLIQALKTYREGAEVLNDWWKIERTYKKTTRDLKYNQLLFEGNMERLLLPLVADDDELLALMADPAGKHWEDAGLELRLRQRLPKSYDLFLENIGEISGLVDSLKKEIGLKGKFGVLLTKVTPCQTRAKSSVGGGLQTCRTESWKSPTFREKIS
jgi:hypothetical protein